MDNSTQNIHLDIEGMTCSSCARTVEKQLKKGGAEDIFVDVSHGEARARVPMNVDAASLAERVSKIGYPAKVHSGEQDDTSHKWTSLEKKLLFSAVLTVPLLFHMFLSHDAFLSRPLVQLGLSLPVYIIGFFHFGKSGLASLKAGAPNMDVLIFTGSTAAFVYSLWGSISFFGTPEVHNYMFFETSASIITLVLLGNLIEQRSVKKTTSAIKELSQIRVKMARRIQGDSIDEIPVEEVIPGDVLQVNTGDQIPVDGVISKGSGDIDESLITGESVPVFKADGQNVVGGTLVLDGNFVMKTTAIGAQTVLSQIVEMVKTAQQNKPEIQRLGDKVSAVFVPAVLGISIITFFISWSVGIDFNSSLMRAIAVLVISCPCAMGLATPTAVMVGLGRAARNGIMIKGARTLEELAKIETIVFDKTGTLTTGRFTIDTLQISDGFDESEVKSALLSLETHSNHPIAVSIARELAGTEPMELLGALELKGKGIKGRDAHGNTWGVGSYRMIDSAELTDADLYVIKNEAIAGRLTISDEIKPLAKQTIDNLKALGIRTVMLSGDKKKTCHAVAEAIGIEEVIAQQLPEEKLLHIQQFVEQGKTAMVGDGINDAPALVQANVGISFSGATEVSINAAQVVLVGRDDLDQVEEALKLGRMTYSTIKQNLFWAFFYNVLAIPVAGLGFLSPIIAALSMAFSDVMVIGNSLRLRFRNLR
jgi:Cu+-exporting ATPase